MNTCGHGEWLHARTGSHNVDNLAACCYSGHMPLNALYTAICRHDGLLLEPPVSQQQSQAHLNAAMDAVTLAGIRQHVAVQKLPDSIFDRMIELKVQRMAEVGAKKSQLSTAPKVPTATPTQDQDSEPEQGG